MLHNQAGCGDAGRGTHRSRTRIRRLYYTSRNSLPNVTDGQFLVPGHGEQWRIPSDHGRRLFEPLNEVVEPVAPHDNGSVARRWDWRIQVRLTSGACTPAPGGVAHAIRGIVPVWPRRRPTSCEHEFYILCSCLQLTNGTGRDDSQSRHGC